MRVAEKERKTAETSIFLRLALDSGDKATDIDTGNGFFDHMLNSFAKHSRFSLSVKAEGDMTGPHHMVEDVGIVLGEAFNEAVGDKAGIERFASLALPMDETLVDVAVDVSGRGYLVFDPPEIQDTETGLSTLLIRDFFYAFAINAKINLHIRVLSGRSFHHLVEAAFKATAVALRRSTTVTTSGVPSAKGTLS